MKHLYAFFRIINFLVRPTPAKYSYMPLVPISGVTRYWIQKASGFTLYDNFYIFKIH